MDYLDETEQEILYYLLKQDKAIPIAKLADFCSVSTNTVRSRIASMNPKIEDYHIGITMKRSIGCQLIQTDHNTITDSTAGLNYIVNRIRYATKDFRCSYILRYLLVHDTFVSADKLCDLLYCSYSELHRSVLKANQLLQGMNSHVHVVTHRGKGLNVEGNEFEKWILLLYLHKTYRYLTAAQQRSEQYFGDYFYTSDDVTQHCRAQFNALLNHYPEYAYCHIDGVKIPNLLFVIKGRHHHENLVQFSKEALKFLENTKSIEIATKYLSSFQWFLGFTPSSNEIAAFAAVIECTRSVLSIDYLPSTAAESIKKDSLLFLNGIFDAYHITKIFLTDEVISQFGCLLYTLKVQNLFNYLVDPETNVPLQNEGTLSYDMAITFHQLYKKRYNIELSQQQTLSPVFLFRQILHDCFQSSGILNICVISIYGYHYASYAAFIIQQFYSTEVKSITALEEFPSYFQQEQLAKYDLLLTDNASGGDIQKFLPTVWLPFITHSGRIPELDTYIQNCVISETWDMLAGHILKISGKNKQDVIFQIYQHLQDKLSISKKAFMNEIDERDSILSNERGNETVLLTSSASTVKTGFIMIFINHQAVAWNTKRIKFFVYYCYPFSNIHKQHLVNNIIKNITWQTSASIESLCHFKNETQFIRAIMKTDI